MQESKLLPKGKVLEDQIPAPSQGRAERARQGDHDGPHGWRDWSVFQVAVKPSDPVLANDTAGKPVAVCGEIAVRPDLALALIALGIDSLSVVPSAIPELKQALAGARLEPMRRAMPGILALSEARLVAAALREAQLG